MTHQQERLPDIEKQMIRFYNAISQTNIESIEDIPAPVFNLIKYYSYEELVKPFVCKDLLSGKTRNAVHIKYGLSEQKIRTIGRELGTYAQWSRK